MPSKAPTTTPVNDPKPANASWIIMRCNISLMLLKCYPNVKIKAPSKSKVVAHHRVSKNGRRNSGSLCKSSSLSSPTKAILAQISNIEKISKVDLAFLPCTSAYWRRVPRINPSWVVVVSSWGPGNCDARGGSIWSVRRDRPVMTLSSSVVCNFEVWQDDVCILRIWVRWSEGEIALRRCQIDRCFFGYWRDRCRRRWRRFCSCGRCCSGWPWRRG